MTNDHRKFISLKEAGRLSGYSRTMLVSLSQWEAEGKQVFSNVAWMTTEEAMQKYLRRQETPAGKKNWLLKFADKMRSSISITHAYNAVIGRRCAYLVSSLSF